MSLTDKAKTVRFPEYLERTFPPVDYERPNAARPPEHTWVGAVDWKAEQLSPAVEREIFASILRPADMRDTTHVDPPSLAWLPVWRVELLVNGRWLYIHGERSGRDPNAVIHEEVDGSITRGIASKTFDNAKVAMVMPARRASPVGSWLVFEEEIANDVEQHRLHSELSGLVPQPEAAERLERGKVIDTDVGEVEARQRGLTGFSNRLSSSSSVEITLSRPKVTVTRADHILWPVYFVPYAYVGDAAPAKRHDPYWVAISARTAAVVGSHHPSVARAIMSRVAHLLSFDKRAFGR